MVSPVEFVRILLTFTGGNPVSISVEQRKGNDIFENERADVEIGSGKAKVTQDNGLSKTIEITPLQAGALDIVIHVVYEDGGISEKQYQLNVVPSSEGVKKFSLNSGFSSMDIILGEDDRYWQSWLSPEVYYDNLGYPIHLT